MKKNLLTLLLFIAVLGAVTYFVTMRNSDDSIDSVDQTAESVNQPTQQDDMQVEVESTAEVREEEITEDINDTVTAELDYQNGTYTSAQSYDLPNGGSHDMDVTVIIENDAVSNVEVVFDGDTSGGSTAIQSRFISAMNPEVVGANVDGISLSRTGGASLTTGAFNTALADIKLQAQG